MKRLAYLHLPVILVGLIAAGLAIVLSVVPDRRLVSRMPVFDPERISSARQAAVSEFVGVMVAERSVDISVPHEGVLKDLLVRVGSAVEAGDLIGYLDDAALRIDLRRAEAALAVSGSEHLRAKVRLREIGERLERRREFPGVVSREDMRSLEAEEEVAQADVDAAVARAEQLSGDIDGLKQEVMQYQIRAPFAGRVASRYLDPGAWVSRGAPIVSLFGGRSCVRFAVPRSLISELRHGSTVMVQDGSSPPQPARVRAVAPDVDSAADLVFVDAALGDDTILTVGVQVRVHLSHTSVSDTQLF